MHLKIFVKVWRNFSTFLRSGADSICFDQDLTTTFVSKSIFLPHRDFYHFNSVRLFFSDQKTSFSVVMRRRNNLRQINFSFRRSLLFKLFAKGVWLFFLCSYLCIQTLFFILGLQQMEYTQCKFAFMIFPLTIFGRKKH